MAPFGIRRVVGAAVAIVVGSGVSARAADCPVDHGQLAQALRASVKASGGPSNGGFENHEWASVVARDGTVCAVAFSGSRAADQWPGSRAISMEKATTANAFSLKAMALSTANLFALAQPGQSLYGIIAASPPSPEGANGDPAQFGTPSDPMTGKRMGGVLSSAVGWRCIKITMSSVGWASAATLPVRITMSPGGYARHLGWTTFRPAQAPNARTRSFTI